MTAPDHTDRLGRRHYTRLTDAVHDNIVKLVQAGNYLSVAAQHQGVGESTLHLWLKTGRDTAAARDAHPDDHLYCPQCDADRTGEVRSVEEHNRAEDAREPRSDDDRASAVGAAPARAYAVLDRCPHCQTPNRPAPWEPNEYQRRCLALLEAVTRADTEAEAAAVVAWRQAFSVDWRAARDYLVRRHPQRWAATTRIAISAEESEQRMDRATQEVLASLGLDTEPGAMPDGDWDEDWSGDVSDAE